MRRRDLLLNILQEIKEEVKNVDTQLMIITYLCTDIDVEEVELFLKKNNLPVDIEEIRLIKKYNNRYEELLKNEA